MIVVITHGDKVDFPIVELDARNRLAVELDEFVIETGLAFPIYFRRYPLFSRAAFPRGVF